MSTPYSTDIFLVQRGSSQYQVPFDRLTEVGDTDLLLVQRGAVQHRVTGVALKAYLTGTEPPPALWTPARITEGLFWFDASDASTVTLSGSNITEWRCKYGTDYDLAQGDSSRQPTYEATGFNGEPAVFFDTSAGWKALIFATNPTQDGGQNIVAALDTTLLQSSWRIFLDRTNGTADNVAIYIGGGGTVTHRPNVYWGGSGGGSWPTPIQRQSITRWHIGPGTSPSATLQVDGATPVTQAFGTSAGPTDWANLNATFDGQDSTYRLSELVVTVGTLSDPDTLVKLEGYLAHKWGMAANLPAGHPYKAAPPMA